MRLRGTLINVLGLLVAAPLLGYSVAHSGPVAFVHDARSMLASSVGMSVGVEQNAYNTVAVQLNAKEADLEKREAAMAQRSAGVDSYGLYSFVMSGILFILVIANFILDYRRRTVVRKEGGVYSVDLRH